MTAPQFFKTAAAFRQWLDGHAFSNTELIVGFFKVGTGRPSMSWSESVDEALCFGWIDGVRNRIDENAYQIRFTPRKPGSSWSAVNIAKFHRLQATGRMTPIGAAAFGHRSEEKSVIYAYEQEEVAKLSPEELSKFQDHEPAWQFFESTPPSYRKVVLHWIVRAKKPETRASRLAKLVEACSACKRL